METKGPWRREGVALLKPAQSAHSERKGRTGAADAANVRCPVGSFAPNTAQTKGASGRRHPPGLVER
jgi:hypothetical protein